MKFLTRLCGSVPADPDLQKRWLESRQPKTKPASGPSADELLAEVSNTTPTIDEEPPGFCVFQRHEGKLVLRQATFRAHIKDCARILSSMYMKKGEEKGERSFSVRALNGVYYPPENYWVPILNTEGQTLDAPTGQFDKPIHVRTFQGERSALKTMEYVDNAMVRFVLRILTHQGGKPVVTEKELEEVFEYGGTHGYGGERSDGQGRYTATFKRRET